MRCDCLIHRLGHISSAVAECHERAKSVRANTTAPGCQIRVMCETLAICTALDVNLMTLMLFMKIASLQATMVGEKPGATRRDHHLHPVLLQIRSPAAPIPRRCKLHNRCNQCSHSSCHRRSIRHSHPEEQQQTVTNAAVNCSQCKEIVCGNCHKRRVATLL